MDIKTELRSDHAALLKLAQQMQATADPQEAHESFVQLRAALNVHARAEESVVYLAIEQAGPDDALEAVREGEVEHSLCDHLVSLMNRTRSHTPMWRARAKVVYELLEHHIEEEHDEMLPLIDQLFDAEQRAALAQRFVDRKAKWAAKG